MKKNYFDKCRLLLRFNFLIILICIISNNLFSQVDSKELLKKMIHKIDSLNSFKCLIQRNFGDISSLSYSYFYKNSSDTIVGYSFVLQNDLGAKAIYNRNKLLVVDLNLTNFRVVDLEKKPLAVRILKSMHCSPVTIKNLLYECIVSNDFNYKLSTNTNGDYQFTVTFPCWVQDGYQFDLMKMPEEMQTTITIKFDKLSFLPVYYEKKDASQKMALVASFNNYKPISEESINVMDSIPEGFNYADEATFKKESLYKSAPNFKLKNINGDSLELNNINKYVLLDFTSLSCGACISATKFLVDKYDNIPNNLEIIAIDIENKSKVDKLNKYIEAEKIRYSYLINGNKVFSIYKGFATPTFVLINKDKMISDILIGFDKEKITEMIKSIK